MTGYVLDQTALGVLGSGNRLMSRLVVSAHDEPEIRLYVPALCLAAAQADRPGLANHVGSLPAVEVVDLGFVGAATVGRLIAEGVDWKLAHAIEVGRPALDWPDGRPVVTQQPGPYAARGVATIHLRA